MSIDTTSPLIRRHWKWFLQKIATRAGQTIIDESDAWPHERYLFRWMERRLFDFSGGGGDFPDTESMFAHYAADSAGNDTVTIAEDFTAADVNLAQNTLLLPDGINLGAPSVITAPGGVEVTFTTTDGLPSPLQVGTPYILSRLSEGQFRVYPVTTVSNQPGALSEETPLYAQDYMQSSNPVTLTDGGTGTQTVHCGPLLERVANLKNPAFPSVVNSSDRNRWIELRTDGNGHPYMWLRLVARDQNGSTYVIHGKGMEQEGDRLTARQFVQGARTVWHTYVCELTNTDNHNLAKAMPDSIDGAGVFTATGQANSQPFAATGTLRIRVRVASVNGGAIPSGLSENTDYWVRSLSGTTFALYPTEADAQADTNRIIPTTSPAHGQYIVWSPEKPGDLERQRDFCEHLQPDGSQNAMSPMTGPLGSTITALGPMSDFDVAGSDAGDFGIAGRHIAGLVDLSGTGVAQVSVFIPDGAVGPTRVDTGQPLESGDYWATRDPASSVRCRLHLSESDALASVGVATNLSNCIKYNAAGDGWYQVEPTGEWQFRIGTPASQTPNAPGLIPTHELAVLTFKIDYLPDDPATVPAATIIRNGAVVAQYDASTDPKGLLGTALNDGAVAWYLFNSPQAHVPLEANVYDIAMGASTAAVDNAELIAQHTWAMSKYGIS